MNGPDRSMQDERPAEAVFLLPGGLALDNGVVLREAELRLLTGHEEEWLAAHPDAPAAIAVTRLLSACLVRLDGVPASWDLVGRLLVGDRDYLMLQLRRMTLGDTIGAVLACPACAARMDVTFRASEAPVERRPQTRPSYTLDLEGGDGPARTVRFRLPRGADQEAVLGLDEESAVAALLARCVLDEGGTPLAPGEATTVIETMDRLAPQIELELELTCPECSHAFVTPFDTVAFFLQEMRATSRGLLREVHALALYYHWSEQEILGLTRARRRAYLELLSEASRPE